MRFNQKMKLLTAKAMSIVEDQLNDPSPMVRFYNASLFLSVQASGIQNEEMPEESNSKDNEIGADVLIPEKTDGK
ncbi:MAG TPA: hypothetical protein PKY59_12220 [Pyrinomonadaceae bacterium]|nr:hypothetical protein [Pyrinomonadaceae bacterium]